MKVSFELNTISSLNLLKLIQEEDLYLVTLEINLASCRIDQMDFLQSHASGVLVAVLLPI